MGELGWGPGSGRGRVTPPSIFPLDLHQPPSPCSFNCCGNFFKVCIVLRGWPTAVSVRVKSHVWYSRLEQCTFQTR